MFKKRNKSSKQNIRKRNDGSDEEEVTKVLVADVRSVQSKNVQSTKRVMDGRDESISSGSVYESSRSIVPEKYAGDATHTSEIDTETDRDARAILERNIKINEEGSVNDKLYRGQAGYKNFIKKDATQIGANKHTGTQGPIRAPTFVRSTARFDYQPDICKDYKETGFCGYGDSCKFLHDRGDYKSGWQLEREWEDAQARKKKKLEESLKGFEEESRTDESSMRITGGDDIGDVDGDSDDDKYAINLSDDDVEEADGGQKIDEDGLPFACYICRSHFTNPIVTLCKHYFCSACALEYAKRNKTKNCALCGKNTSGVFNHAAKLARKIAKAEKS